MAQDARLAKPGPRPYGAAPIHQKAFPMLALFRRFLNTWAARAFFLVLIGSFCLWGISGTITNLNKDTALATVGDARIEPAEFQEDFRKQLNQVSRMLGGTTEPTPQIKRAVGQQVLDRLVTQAAIMGETRRLGIAVPEEALKQAVFAMPVFRGRTGAFDRTTFTTVLRQNNFTEQRFLELLRADLGQRQLVEAVQVGAGAPETMIREVYAFQKETRTAHYVEFAFAAAPAPPAPTDDDLHRFYDNDPASYSAPAYRRVKMVVLSPETVAREIEVPEAEIATYFETHASEFTQPEKRSVQVVIAQDQARAAAIARGWIAGADWDAVQKLAAEGAASAALDDATPAEFPAPELATAVFAAAPDIVTGPVQSSLGWQVFRVTKITPGASRNLADATPEIREKIARTRAVDEVYARANKLEDAISATGSLDQIPADIGAEPAYGQLDAMGNTPSGDPAPLPGPAELRPVLLTAAFALAKGEPPRMTEGPGQSYFAMVVEESDPPQLKPYEVVAERVRDDWERDARRRVQEQEAAKLLAATKAGTSLDDAATIAGERLQRTPPHMRGTAPEGLAPALAERLFEMKPNDATMVETPDAFLVATLGDVVAPDAAADVAGAGQLRAALTQSVGQDIEITLAAALRSRAKPTVNRTMLDSLTQ